MLNPKPVSLSNERLGTFHVLDLADRLSKSGHTQYWCRCDCGHEQRIRAQSIRKGLRGEWRPICKGCGA